MANSKALWKGRTMSVAAVCVDDDFGHDFECRIPCYYDRPAARWRSGVV